MAQNRVARLFQTQKLSIFGQNLKIDILTPENDPKSSIYTIYTIKAVREKNHPFCSHMETTHKLLNFRSDSG